VCWKHEAASAGCEKEEENKEEKWKKESAALERGTRRMEGRTCTRE